MQKTIEEMVGSLHLPNRSMRSFGDSGNLRYRRIYQPLGDTKLIFRFTGELGEKKGSVGRNKNNINILMISFNHRQ